MYYNRSNLKVRNMNSTQGIQRVVVTGNVKYLPTKRQEECLWLGLFSFIRTVTSILFCSIHNQIICVRHCYKLYQQNTPLYYRHASLSTCSHERPLRSPQTQPCLASQPLLLKLHSCMTDACRKGHRTYCSQGDKAAVSL